MAETRRVPVGVPVRFLALEWREDWDRDFPSVLLEPFVRFTPHGQTCDQLIEDAAVDIAIEEGDFSPVARDIETSHLMGRHGPPARLKEIAEAVIVGALHPELGVGYVGASQQWVVFREGPDGLDCDFVDNPVDVN